MVVGGQCDAPATLPPGKTHYPLYRVLGGPQGRTGMCGKSCSAPGFDPRIVKRVASRYTDWAIPAQDESINNCIIIFIIITITTSHRVSATQACSGFIDIGPSIDSLVVQTFLFHVGMYSYTNLAIRESCNLSKCCAHSHLRCTTIQFKL